MTTSAPARKAARLDPVRWRRPGRSALVRWATVALLLGTAAVVVQVRNPAACTVGQAAASVPQPDGSGTAAPRTVPPGSVGVPVRLAEPAALALLRAGDRVDLMAASTGEPRRLAVNALVLGVHSADELAGGLFLALTADEAKATVGAPGDTRFAVLVRSSG